MSFLCLSLKDMAIEALSVFVPSGNDTARENVSSATIPTGDTAPKLLQVTLDALLMLLLVL